MWSYCGRHCLHRCAAPEDYTLGVVIDRPLDRDRSKRVAGQLCFRTARTPMAPSHRHTNNRWPQRTASCKQCHSSQRPTEPATASRLQWTETWTRVPDCADAKRTQLARSHDKHIRKLRTPCKHTCVTRRPPLQSHSSGAQVDTCDPPARSLPLSFSACSRL